MAGEENRADTPRVIPPGLLARVADVFADETSWAFNISPGPGNTYDITVFAGNVEIWSGRRSRNLIDDDPDEPGVSFSADMDAFIAEVRANGKPRGGRG